MKLSSGDVNQADTLRFYNGAPPICCIIEERKIHELVLKNTTTRHAENPFTASTRTHRGTNGTQDTEGCGLTTRRVSTCMAFQIESFASNDYFSVKQIGTLGTLGNPASFRALKYGAVELDAQSIECCAHTLGATIHGSSKQVEHAPLRTRAVLESNKYKGHQAGSTHGNISTEGHALCASRTGHESDPHTRRHTCPSTWSVFPLSLHMVTLEALNESNMGLRKGHQASSSTVPVCSTYESAISNRVLIISQHPVIVIALQRCVYQYVARTVLESNSIMGNLTGAVRESNTHSGHQASPSILFKCNVCNESGIV